jgi:hypothetical protein
MSGPYKIIKYRESRAGARARMSNVNSAYRRAGDINFYGRRLKFVRNSRPRFFSEAAAGRVPAIRVITNNHNFRGRKSNG